MDRSSSSLCRERHGSLVAETVCVCVYLSLCVSLCLSVYAYLCRQSLELIPRPPLLCRLDGKHVVFGQVIEGMNVVEEMEKIGSESGAVSKKIIVEACGELDD
jgi:hypothetical protein